MKVLPIREVVGDKGTTWEYGLSQRGWNDLSLNDKMGEVVGWFKLPSGEVTCDVYFAAIDWTAVNVFEDEIVIVE